MDKRILSLYGLKWNPFAADVPVEALYAADHVQHFGSRIEHLAQSGGFAVLTGDPGMGKSSILRQLLQRLDHVQELRVGILTRPQGSVSDFYRELGDIFAVRLTGGNRWGGTRALRERWQQHIEQSLFRPVLLIDDAQQLSSRVLTELRILLTADLDSRQLLTVVLSGDNRLPQRFLEEELIPVASRVRVRLALQQQAPDGLSIVLTHLLSAAGNPVLMTDGVKETVCEHALGNLRALMTTCDELLIAGIEKKAERLDEKLYFDTFHVDAFATPARGDKRPRRR